MAAPAPTYFPQQQLDGDWSVYSADGSLVLADIETLGDARNHILDLIDADQQAAFDAASPELEAALDAILAKQQAHNAALDDFHAQAHAMAYGPAVTEAA